MAPKVSIVMATYNRSHLLKRSLMGYATSSFRDVELVVVDDWSEDETEKLCRDWSKDLNIHYMRPRPKIAGEWRDCSSVINEGLRAATGTDLIIATHPEVIPGVNTIYAMWEHRRHMLYHCAKVYYLTPDNQVMLDSVLWEMDRLSVRELPGFYDDTQRILGPASEYTHAATDRHESWESWVFGGFTRDTWQMFGPMTESVNWGYIDIDFVDRRRAAGIRSLTEMEPSTFVLHQNHDLEVKENPHFKTTPRDMDKAMADHIRYNQYTALKGPLWPS